MNDVLFGTSRHPNVRSGWIWVGDTARLCSRTELISEHQTAGCRQAAGGFLRAGQDEAQTCLRRRGPIVS